MAGCDVCEEQSGGTEVGVAAVPGAPISLMWCTECLAHNAVPRFVVESWLFYDVENLPADPPPSDVFAEWARGMSVWTGDRYVPFDDVVEPMWREEQARRAAA